MPQLPLSAAPEGGHVSVLVHDKGVVLPRGCSNETLSFHLHAHLFCAHIHVRGRETETTAVKRKTGLSVPAALPRTGNVVFVDGRHASAEKRLGLCHRTTQKSDSLKPEKRRNGHLSKRKTTAKDGENTRHSVNGGVITYGLLSLPFLRAAEPGELPDFNRLLLLLSLLLPVLLLLLVLVLLTLLFSLLVEGVTGSGLFLQTELPARERERERSQREGWGERFLGDTRMHPTHDSRAREIRLHRSCSQSKRREKLGGKEGRGVG